MILTVTCNPATDVTYTVDSLAPGEVHRVRSVVERPGGKGVNVSRVLQQLGETTTATGLADEAFDAAVEASGVPAAFVPVLPKVRRTLVVQAPGETTSLWEPGPTVEPAVASTLEGTVQVLLETATALVVSGSLPVGLPVTLPVDLARLAVARGLPVVLDLDDAPLRAAADGSGAVLVPNRDELFRLLDAGGSLDVVPAAAELSRRSGAPVVVTLGADGMLAVDGSRCWHAVAPEPVPGNATGAGDAAAAAIVRGLARAEAWPEILADAVALSAAAVRMPVAGEVDLEAYRTWRPQVRAVPVESLPIGK
ncbi:MAG TPA: hexose kinase [Nocardioidaceae bacterium]|nr:hexose kinase [Nocardioidaceae bacterium]